MGRLNVNDDHLTTGFDHRPDMSPGVGHHEMGFERQIHDCTTGCDDCGTERDVRHKGPVHDVPLDAIDPGLGEGGHLIAET